jgi:hypothetical protein
MSPAAKVRTIADFQIIDALDAMDVCAASNGVDFDVDEEFASDVAALCDTVGAALLTALDATPATPAAANAVAAAANAAANANASTPGGGSGGGKDVDAPLSFAECAALRVDIDVRMDALFKVSYKVGSITLASVNDTFLCLAFAIKHSRFIHSFLSSFLSFIPSFLSIPAVATPERVGGVRVIAAPAVVCGGAAAEEETKLEGSA